MTKEPVPIDRLPTNQSQFLELLPEEFLLLFLLAFLLAFLLVFLLELLVLLLLVFLLSLRALLLVLLEFASLNSSKKFLAMISSCLCDSTTKSRFLVDTLQE